MQIPRGNNSVPALPGEQPIRDRKKYVIEDYTRGHRRASRYNSRIRINTRAIYGRDKMRLIEIRGACVRAT